MELLSCGAGPSPPFSTGVFRENVGILALFFFGIESAMGKLVGAELVLRQVPLFQQGDLRGM